MTEVDLDYVAVLDAANLVKDRLDARGKKRLRQCNDAAPDLNHVCREWLTGLIEDGTVRLVHECSNVSPETLDGDILPVGSGGIKHGKTTAAKAKAR